MSQVGPQCNVGGEHMVTQKQNKTIHGLMRGGSWPERHTRSPHAGFRQCCTSSQLAADSPRTHSRCYMSSGVASQASSTGQSGLLCLSLHTILGIRTLQQLSLESSQPPILPPCGSSMCANPASKCISQCATSCHPSPRLDPVVLPQPLPSPHQQN